MEFLEEAASVAKACSIGIWILITGLPSAPEQEDTGWNLLDLLVLAFTLASGCKMSSPLFAIHQSLSADLVVFLHVKCRETAGIMNPLKATCVGDVFDFICARTQTHVFLLANKVMFGQLPGNYSKLYPEWELVKNTL